MKKYFIFIISIILLFFNELSFGAKITLKSVADAFICSDDWANLNSGDYDFSRRAVGRQNAYNGLQIGRQLYMFELPNGIASIDGACLTLKVLDNFAGYPVDTAIFGAEDDWEEYSVTWNTQPSFDSSLIDSITASCCGRVYTYDVTSYVQDQFEENDYIISFIQASENEDIVEGVRWFQRESDGKQFILIEGQAPRLSLTFTPVPTTTTTVKNKKQQPYLWAVPQMHGVWHQHQYYWDFTDYQQQQILNAQKIATSQYQPLYLPLDLQTYKLSITELYFLPQKEYQYWDFGGYKQWVGTGHFIDLTSQIINSYY